MKILILDPEKKVSHRISKDTSGGYGTGNDFGDTPIPVFLKKTLKKVHDWPPMFALYSMAVLKKFGHDVQYQKSLPSTCFLSVTILIVVSLLVLVVLVLLVVSSMNFLCFIIEKKIIFFIIMNIKKNKSN